MSGDTELRHVAFHGVGTPGPEREPGEHDYWVTTDEFLRILDECVGRPGARISFDDGNASDVETALPALVERGLTAAFFPVAERIGTPGNVDRDGLRALVAAGMTVVTHGAGHRAWPTLPDADPACAWLPPLGRGLWVARRLRLRRTVHSRPVSSRPAFSATAPC